MKILLAAGSDPQNWPALTEAFDLYCGIDRGSLYLLERGCPVSLAIGDFDSLSEGERKTVAAQVPEMISSQAEKDDTDTQLALLTIFQRWPEAQVLLIGATGGRLDHLLANLWLGLEPRFQPFVQQLTIADKQNHLSYLLPGEHTVTQQAGMKYLAYCCLTPVTKLTLRESKYLLTEVEVTVPTSYASNEFLKETAKVSFTSGTIAVIQSRD